MKSGTNINKLRGLIGGMLGRSPMKPVTRIHGKKKSTKIKSGIMKGM